MSSCACLSVTSRCSTETAKRKTTQTTPHDSPGTLVFWCPRYRQNSNGFTPNGSAKCRFGRLNAGAVDANWRLSTRSVVNLVRSQVCQSHWASTLFAARSPWCSALRGFVSDRWSLYNTRTIAVYIACEIIKISKDHRSQTKRNQTQFSNATIRNSERITLLYMPN